MRTRGKAGYRVWKFAGGQGDHDMSLPLGSFEVIIFFALLVFCVFVANPFSIAKKLKVNFNKNKQCM